MSCYEWEAGTIKLPTAEVVKVRDAVKNAHAARAAQLYQQTQTFWKGLTAAQKRDREKYDGAVRTFVERFSDAADHKDMSGLLSRWNQPISRVTQTDVKRVLGTATGANFRLDLDGAWIEFKGREVHWRVGENNRACERARDHPMAKALFAALSRVKWTRGSGGQIVGNNEYNRDDRSAGGGGNYVVSEYGPKVRQPTAAGRWW